MNTNTIKEEENKINEELRGMLESYRDELKAIAEGKLYEDENGEYERIEDESELAEKEERDERDPVSVFDYFDRRGLGDIRFEVNLHKERTGGKILVAFGGPNIWIHEREIHGYWGWTSHEIVYLDEETTGVVESYLDELWEMTKEA